MFNGYRVVNNPFSVPDYDPDDSENSDPDIMQLHGSIKANGVQTPLLVRQISTNPENIRYYQDIDEKQYVRS